MSDRPMRLKYLKTKMDFAFCIFLLYITAVSVFGQSVELNGIVGKSIEFPAAVKIEGNLMYSGVTIGDMTGGRFTRARSKFSGRLQWDSSTGLFSLSGLELEDSGEYKVQNTDQNINTVFQLNVYKDNVPVSKPHLNVTHNEYRCTVLCAAARGTGVTLRLYKNGEMNPYVTSPVRSHPDLNVTVPVESGTYTCEAKNSVGRETSDPLTVEAHCTVTAPAGPCTGTIVAIVIAVLIALITVVFAFLYHSKRRIIQANRRIIQVKNLLDILVPPAYDHQPLPEHAVRTIILVKNLLDNLVPPTYDQQPLPEPAVRRILLVQKLLGSLDPPENDQQALPQNAVRKIHLVKDSLDKVDPCALRNAMVAFPPDDEDEMALIRDAVTRIFLGKAVVAFSPDYEGKQAIEDAVRRIFLELRGVSERKHELGREEGDPPPN